MCAGLQLWKEEQEESQKKKLKHLWLKEVFTQGLRTIYSNTFLKDKGQQWNLISLARD